MLIRPDERIVFFGDSLTCRTDLLDSADPAAIRWTMRAAMWTS